MTVAQDLQAIKQTTAHEQAELREKYQQHQLNPNEFLLLHSQRIDCCFAGPFNLPRPQILSHHGSGCGIDALNEDFQELLQLVADGVGAGNDDAVGISRRIDPQHGEPD